MTSPKLKGATSGPWNWARTIASSWNEADALAALGRCAMADGHPAQARVLLQHALEILQQIGGADAPEVATELDAITEPQPAEPGA